MISSFTFDLVEPNLISSIYSSHDDKQMLMQWGLDDNVLSISCFRFTGNLFDECDYITLLKAFLCDAKVRLVMKGSGTPILPLDINYTELSMKTLSMGFFDRLKERNILTKSGDIKGTFNEQYAGIDVDDMLKDFFVNPESENKDLYNDEERSEFLFHILKIFVLGGDMCQPDTNISRYLDSTRKLYKNLLTVYKKDDGELTVSGKCFDVQSIEGMTFYDSTNPRNRLLVLIDQMKGVVNIIRNAHQGW
jgi:cilia- and flagella-associated protein 300